MNLFKKIFTRKNKPNVELNLEDELFKQTGDAAFLHKTNWIVAFGKEDFKTALNELNKALEIVPDNPEYLSLRAMTYYSLGNYAEMIYDFKSAINVNPNQKEANEFLESLKTEAIQLRDKSRKLASEKKFDEAVIIMNKAVGIEPENLYNYYFRGILYSQLNNIDNAIKDLKYVSSIDANFQDTQKVLQVLLNIDNSTKQNPSNNLEYYCFVCSNNGSLISSFYESFQSAGLNLPMDNYSIDTEVIRAKSSDAKLLELSFNGIRFFGQEEENINKFDDFMNRIAGASNQKLHIFYIVAQEEMYLKIKLFYEHMFTDAVNNQGMWPFPMFVTQNADARDFLIEIFK